MEESKDAILITILLESGEYMTIELEKNKKES